MLKPIFPWALCKALGLVLMVGLGAAQAQEVSIAQGGTYTGCEFFFVDNGLTAGDASPNSDFTMTFCPDMVADPVISFYFNLFALGEGDVMNVWFSDEATGAPDGVFTGFDLQGVDIWSQMDGVTNASGCITWQFTSDATDNSNWTAEVVCEEPCQRPEANVVTTIDGAEETVPLQICVGEEIQFDGSGSTAAEEFLIATWEWDFDDGATDESGPVVTHSFDEPGAYNVQLYLVDNNDCPNGNLVDHLILVSTPTSFEGTTQNLQICAGEEYPVAGVAQGITYDSEPEVDLGGGLFIPDDQTQCFSSSIVLTAFNSGQVIQSEDDFENFFINFEHSFMGDLTVTFICPDGSALGVHQQGGGGTFLGEPVDNDADPDNPGVGYDYFWSPEATNGSWGDNGGGTLPTGTYESAQPWTLLEGCPLNGTWTIEVCDSWGSDNGFIFDWYINFDPALYPEPIVFTPQIGADCDSSFWTGPFIVDDGGDCDGITILPENQGIFEYVYTATNDFGCTSYDTMVVTVEPAPEVSLTAQDNWCGVPVGLNANTTGIPSNLDVEWTWESTGGDLEPITGSNNGATASVDGLDAPVEVTVTMNLTGGDIDECLATATVPVGLYAPPVLGPDEELYGLCIGDNHILVPGLAPSEWDLEFEWSSGSNGLLPNQTESSLTVNSTDVYSVTVSMAPPCIGEDAMSFNVNFGPCAIEAIPNVFTPNADGENDAFEIKGNAISTLGPTISVYNRWGELIHYEQDYENTWSPDEDEVAGGMYYLTLDINSYSLPLEEIEHNGVITKLEDGFRYVGALQILRNRQ
ncbi:gliding motility-associated C-terminal domain-containing protein [Flavobacteriales bacterium]|nr:gliding motility-associated C-terminal domain-containing protein [Flavobacteriales bacterium]